jgi:hypothetical protein
MWNLSRKWAFEGVRVDGSYVPLVTELGAGVIEFRADEIVDAAFHVFAQLWFESDVVSVEGCACDFGFFEGGLKLAAADAGDIADGQENGRNQQESDNGTNADFHRGIHSAVKFFVNREGA